MDILSTIRVLGFREKSFIGRTFIAPVFDPSGRKSDRILACVDTIVIRVKIPPTENGWHRFRLSGMNSANYDKEADFSDIEEYLSKLPKGRAVVFDRINGCLRGIAITNKSKKEFDTISIVLPDLDGTGDFDTIIYRELGPVFLYEALDMRSDPSKSEYLRECLSKSIPMDGLKFGGVSIYDKIAYGTRFAMEERKRGLTKEERLKAAVEHAGGKFLSFTERGDRFEVSMEVDGDRHTSYVRKDGGMEVISAGICLEGRDSDFDLKSLVSVFQENRRRTDEW